MYIIGARADVSRDQALSDSDSDESDDDDDMQGTEQGDEVRQMTCSWLQGTLCTSISLFYIHTYIDNDSPDRFLVLYMLRTLIPWAVIGLQIV